jgi:Ni/Fe-hydrogenase 1 B-type cytochrome subunit
MLKKMNVEPVSDRVLSGPVENVYVYETPLRIWHWVTVLMMFPLIITGFLIGNPPLVQGLGLDATFQYNFATIRWVHFSCAMIFTVAFLLRIYWAFVGNHHARSLFVLPVWNKAWWKGLIDQTLSYLFVKKAPEWIGHNPLAQAAMFVMYALGTLFIIITGFALFAQQWPEGHWWMWSFGWVFSVFGDAQAVRTAHHLAMYWLIVFAIAHMYMVFREDIMGGESVVGTMVNGIRMFKQPDEKHIDA